MPAVDDPLSLAASLPGQLADAKRQIKDLAANNTQAISQALAAATAASAAASAASVAASAAATAANNARMTAAVGNSAAAGYTLTTGYATLASFALTVPAGFTRALVSVSVFAAGASGAGSADRIYVQAVTNGVTGPESITATAPSLPVGSASAFQTQNLSGLTGGATITISVQAHLAVGPGSPLFTNATASATAIFQV